MVVQISVGESIETENVPQLIVSLSINMLLVIKLSDIFGWGMFDSMFTNNYLSFEPTKETLKFTQVRVLGFFKSRFVLFKHFFKTKIYIKIRYQYKWNRWKPLFKKAGYYNLYRTCKNKWINK